MSVAVVRQFKIKTSQTAYSEPYDIGAEAKNVRATINIPRMEQPRIVDTNTIITELNDFRLKFYEEGCFYSGEFSETWPYTATVECLGLKTDDPFIILVGPMLDIETDEGVFVDTTDTIVENLTARKINFSKIDEAVCSQDDQLVLTSYLSKPDPFMFYIRLYSGTQTIANVVTIGEQNLVYFGENVYSMIQPGALIDTRGNVFGTVLYVPDYSGYPYSTESGDKKGFYVPLRLKNGVVGEQMTLKYNNEVIASGIPFNSQIVAKIKDRNDTFTVTVDGKELFTLNFKNVKFVQPSIYDNVKIAHQDSIWLGKYASDLVKSNVTILPDGRVIGTFPYVVGYDGYSEDFEEGQGHFLPLNILATGTNMTIIKNGTVVENNIPFAKDLLMPVDSRDDVYEVLIDGESVFVLNMKDADLLSADFEYVVENGVYLKDENGNYLTVPKKIVYAALTADQIVLSGDSNKILVSKIKEGDS